MKIYYSIDGKTWVKGSLTSHRGCKDAHFFSDDGKELVINTAEYCFHGKGFSVTGYVKAGEFYELESVYVSKTKPKMSE